MSDQSAEILAAVKDIAAYSNFQRKFAKWCLWCLIPIFLLFLGASFLLTHYVEQRMKRSSDVTQKEHDWYDVNYASRKGDLEKALSIADELLLRNPRDFEGYYKKGELLLMLNDGAGALNSFKKAEEIFPLPKYQSAVEALEKADAEKTEPK